MCVSHVKLSLKVTPKSLAVINPSVGDGRNVRGFAVE